jgi:heat-inducible transcriptional repressor
MGKVYRYRNLSQRRSEILKVTVKEYIQTGLPVASSRLVRQYHLKVSSATVRNDLAFLEDRGYLKQPHISAGRIPTEKGYHYYVDLTKDNVSLSSKERNKLLQLFSVRREIDELLQNAAALLSQITSCLTYIFAPSISKSRVRHVDLIPLSTTAALLVLITNTGQVGKRAINFKEKVGEERLRELEKELNEEIFDCSLEEVKEIGKNWKSDDRKKILKEITAFLLEEEEKYLYWSGADFFVSRLQKEEPDLSFLIRAFEKAAVLQLVKEAVGHEGIIVKIGSENPPGLEMCSFIGIGYFVGQESWGSMGILGPVRMNYPQAISALRLGAAELSRALSVWYS